MVEIQMCSSMFKNSNDISKTGKSLLIKVGGLGGHMISHILYKSHAP